VKEEEAEKGRQDIGTSICNIKNLIATVNVSLPQPFKYAYFRHFFNVMFSKHAQKLIKFALKLTYGNVKIKKFPWKHSRTPSYRRGTEGR
jgi:hypothetical protein